MDYTNQYQIEKYSHIISLYPNAGVRLLLTDNNECIVLTQNIFPVHRKYIKREFLVNGTPSVIHKSSSRREILKKVKKMKALLMSDKHYFSKKVKELYHRMLKVPNEKSDWGC